MSPATVPHTLVALLLLPGHREALGGGGGGGGTQQSHTPRHSLSFGHVTETSDFLESSGFCQDDVFGVEADLSVCFPAIKRILVCIIIVLKWVLQGFKSTPARLVFLNSLLFLPSLTLTGSRQVQQRRGGVSVWMENAAPGVHSLTGAPTVSSAQRILPCSMSR